MGGGRDDGRREVRVSHMEIVYILYIKQASTMPNSLSPQHLAGSWLPLAVVQLWAGGGRCLIGKALRLISRISKKGGRGSEGMADG